MLLRDGQGMGSVSGEQLQCASLVSLGFYSFPSLIFITIVIIAIIIINNNNFYF